MSAADDVLREFLQRAEVLFGDLGKRVDVLSMEVAQNNAGINMAMAKLDAVDETLARNLTEMQQLRRTLIVVQDGMLNLSADLQLTRSAVAEQVTHEVEKKLDAHLSLVELAEVAESAAGNER